MEILNNSDNSQYISESFFFINLPFYNLPQLIFENNIDEVAAVIGETKASSFFGIFHHIGQRLGRYRCHFGSNVVFELFYGLWLIGINFTLQKSPQKEVRWSQIWRSWRPVNITVCVNTTDRLFSM